MLIQFRSWWKILSTFVTENILLMKLQMGMNFLFRQTLEIFSTNWTGFHLEQISGRCWQCQKKLGTDSKPADLRLFSVGGGSPKHTPRCLSAENPLVEKVQKSSNETSVPAVLEDHNNVCGKNFTAKRSLQEHKKLHLDQEFKCKECSSIFKTERSIKQHQINVHTKEHYLCDQCPKTFTCKASLKQHVRRHWNVITLNQHSVLRAN